MSQENVETMRTVIDAFNRREGAEFGAFLAPDAEIVPIRAAVEGTTYHGRNAAVEYCGAVEQSWEGLRWEVEDVRDGENWVLALGRIRGRGRGSGVEIDAHGGWLANFRDGLITRFQTFSERDHALEAAGLSE
jgi:ketosteroid isomerase-like protein